MIILSGSKMFRLIVILFCLAKGIRASEPPGIQPIPVPKVTSEGQKIRLTCLASRGSPPLTFQWLKDGEVLQEQGNYKLLQLDEDTSVLAINGLKWSNSGRFECRVKNAFGQAESAVELVVQGDLRMTTSID